MKITIKDTEHAKIYYPELIGKTFENCEELNHNDFIKIPYQKIEGNQNMVIKADCIILENENILKEVRNIKNYLSKIVLDEDIILNRYVSEYLNEIEKSANNIKEKYNDMLRSHE